MIENQDQNRNQIQLSLDLPAQPALQRALANDGEVIVRDYVNPTPTLMLPATI